MPSGNKPLPEPMLTPICVSLWHHWATMSSSLWNVVIVHVYILLANKKKQNTMIEWFTQLLTFCRQLFHINFPEWVIVFLLRFLWTFFSRVKFTTKQHWNLWQLGEKKQVIIKTMCICENHVIGCTIIASPRTWQSVFKIFSFCVVA